ncbi:unnamed protein product [Protopolystoma xenopodis]|uniref:Ig-like domain-containing protein n=1 Tax=Protopolystoma xenopodis TaxID=117903 RepID=A0A448WPL1_9PLAT|nr:unnamed protein product [Protopolystoma xenopodis]
MAGQPVNMTCTAAQSPLSPWYTFTWYRQGDSLPPAHAVVQVSETVSVLTLMPATAEDNGVYACAVRRDDGSPSPMPQEASSKSNNFERDPAIMKIELIVHRKCRNFMFYCYLSSNNL